MKRENFVPLNVHPLHPKGKTRPAVST